MLTVHNKKTAELKDFLSQLRYSNPVDEKALFEKWNFAKSIDKAAMGMAHTPIRSVLDESSQKIGYVLFDHYKIIQDKTSNNLKLMINPNTYRGVNLGFKDYDYPFNHRFLMGSSERIDDFQWIMDIELSKNTISYNSHLWERRWQIGKISYLELAVLIKFAVRFGVLDQFNHGLLNEYEGVKKQEGNTQQMEFDVTESLALSMHKFFLFWARNNTLDHEWFEHRHWESSVNQKFKESLSGMIVGRWRTWFLYQTNCIRICEFIYFKKRYNPYLNDILRVENYSTAQLFYLFHIDQYPESFADLNYFSYEKMVTDFDRVGFKLTFPNKLSLKRFNQMNAEFVAYWLQHRVELSARYGVTGLKDINISEVEIFELYKDAKINTIQKTWIVLMYILTHSQTLDYGHGKTSANRIISITDRLNISDFKRNGKELGRCFDFIYRHTEELQNRYQNALNEINDKVQRGVIGRDDMFKRKEELDDAKWQLVTEIDDYICSKDENNQLEHVGNIDSKTSYKGIHRKTQAWHKKLNLKNLEEMQRNNKIVKYAHVNPRKQAQGDSTFIPIKTNYELFKEGIEKSHCIKTYHDRIAKAVYLAYQVERGEEKATLGIKFNTALDNPYHFDQCFGIMNSRVSLELKVDAMCFVDKLNQNYRKKGQVA